MKIKKQTGFTLIELMVVLVIISIIMAYAVPSYRQYVLRAKRSEALNALLLTASLQEKYYANNNTYGTDANLNLATTYPAPTVANKRAYTISMVNTATSYTIKAVAYGGQTEDTGCTEFTIDHLGTKKPVSGKCW